MSGLQSNTGLTFCIEFNSLASYVALSGTRKLVQDRGLEMHWLPMIKETDYTPAKISPDDPLAEYKERRARARRNNRQREMERDYELLGIADVDGNALSEPANVNDNANYGLLWLTKTEAGPEVFWNYVESVYSSVFRKAAGNVSVSHIADLLNESDAEVAGFEEFVGSGSAAQKQKSAMDQIHEFGLFQSPAYICRGEKYQGRQHLPLMHWLLGGREGNPPV
jgi:2-hydroxychromene-2-carboxylate isomerase